jgi:hypothetical protein
VTGTGAARQAPAQAEAAGPGWLAVVLGLPAGLALLALAVALAAAIYGGGSARRGGLMGSVITALLVFGASAALSRLAVILTDGAVMALVVAAGLATFVLGHAFGYGHEKDFAWQYVHEISPARFGPDWQGLDRDENFRRFVGWVTGRAGGGVWGYLRLQAALGAHSSHHTRMPGVRREWSVRGLGVWLMRIAQATALVVAGGVGAVAGRSRGFAASAPAPPPPS